MNRFIHHHRQSISFTYSCFDRIILNGIVQPLQDGQSVCNFFQQRGQAATKNFLVGLSSQYHEWVQKHAAVQGIDIIRVERRDRRHAPHEGRRENLVQPYFQKLYGRTGVAVILRAREPERIAVCYPGRGNAIELQSRYIDLYYFYLQHPQAGRMWLRVCPYFPFNIRFWMNGHDWLALRLRDEGIAFSKCDNSFTACGDPERLQELADAFGPADLEQIVAPLLQQFVPYYRTQAVGLEHRLFMTQMEYCHNIIFHKTAVARRLFERLLDHSRWLGHPQKVGMIFRRRTFRPQATYADVRTTMLGTPVIRAGFDSTSIKQYLRPGGLLRSEAACFQLRDLSMRKAIDFLPRLRGVLAQSTERYLSAQQDILETYLDRGEMERLRQPSVSPTGRRTPGLHLDDRRLLAILQAVTAFAYLIGKGCFRTRDLLDQARRALDQPDYKLSQLRYDLAKLRGKGLVQRVPGTQTYQVTDEGYRIAVLYLKLYHRLYAPLTAAILEPYPPDNEVLTRRRAKIDRLYAAVDHTLQELTHHLGLAQTA